MLAESIERQLEWMHDHGFEVPWMCDLCQSNNDGWLSMCQSCTSPNENLKLVMDAMGIEEVAALADDCASDSKLAVRLREEHPLVALARARGVEELDAVFAYSRAQTCEKEERCDEAAKLYNRAFKLWPDLHSNFDSYGVPQKLRGEFDAFAAARGMTYRIPQRMTLKLVPTPLASTPGGSSLLQPQIWKRLEVCQRILLAGCGGGYDVYQAIPLYFTLRAMGKEVYLANLTFSSTFAFGNTLQPVPGLFNVTASSTSSLSDYCPELHLVQYLKGRHGIDETIYTIAPEGYANVTCVYEHLADTLHLDAILVVDGGTDSLMAGDEEKLGTIEEDHISMIAVNDVHRDLKLRCLVVLGLGVDRFHGCSDAASLRAIAELTVSDGMLGMQLLTMDMVPVQYYKEAVAFADGECRDSPSIVAASVISAIEGHYGNYHANPRTQGSAMFINPMLGTLWFFDLACVIHRWQPGLAEALRETITRESVKVAVQNFRYGLKDKNKIRSVEEFPRTHDFETVVAVGL